mmetsp:Transcript_6495/g.29661  ORF Transcript_6495/g.29661 Transcript_6495/m.29661 type:complete len:409 (+) Transcript_6495:241-1467(+)
MPEVLAVLAHLQADGAHELRVRRLDPGRMKVRVLGARVGNGRRGIEVELRERPAERPVLPAGVQRLVIAQQLVEILRANVPGASGHLDRGDLLGVAGSNGRLAVAHHHVLLRLQPQRVRDLLPTPVPRVANERAERLFVQHQRDLGGGEKRLEVPVALNLHQPPAARPVHAALAMHVDQYLGAHRVLVQWIAVAKRGHPVSFVPGDGGRRLVDQLVHQTLLSLRGPQRRDVQGFLHRVRLDRRAAILGHPAVELWGLDVGHVGLVRGAADVHLGHPEQLLSRLRVNLHVTRDAGLVVLLVLALVLAVLILLRGALLRDIPVPGVAVPVLGRLGIAAAGLEPNHLSLELRHLDLSPRELRLDPLELGRLADGLGDLGRDRVGVRGASSGFLLGNFGDVRHVPVALRRPR